MAPEKRAHQAVTSLPEPDHVEHVAKAVGGLTPRHPVELDVEAEVLLGGRVVVQRGVLEVETDALAHLRLLGGDVEARDSGRTRRRAQEGAEHGDRGRLTRAVRSQEAERLASRHIEAHTSYCFEVTEAAGEPHDLDGGLAGFVRTFARSRKKHGVIAKRLSHNLGTTGRARTPRVAGHAPVAFGVMVLRADDAVSPLGVI